jgi:hypothetical protein
MPSRRFVRSVSQSRDLAALTGAACRRTIDNPAKTPSNVEIMSEAVAAYKAFDKREPGWIKVALIPDTAAARSFFHSVWTASHDARSIDG